MDNFKNLLFSILHNNSVTVFTALAIIFCIWLLEWFKPAIKDRGFESRFENILIYTLCVFGLTLLSLVTQYFIPYFLPEKSILQLLSINVNSESFNGIVISIITYALVWDFFQYWLHRAEHRFTTIWIFHRLHHDDKFMNSSTTVRQSFGGEVLAYCFVHIPTLIICGVQFLPYIGTIILFNAVGYFNHANVKFSFGKLNYVFSNPHIHRVHHGLNKDYHDRNYAAFFTFYDVIFGTFKNPKQHEWPETGINEATQKLSLIDNVFFPWRKVANLEKV